MNQERVSEERVAPEETPAPESDFVEVLDLPGWVGVAVGVILVLIAITAALLSK